MKASQEQETVLECNIELKVTLVIVSRAAFFQISVCCNSPVTISALHVSYQYKNGKCEHLSAMNINSEPYQHQITVRGLPRGYGNIHEIFRKEKNVSKEILKLREISLLIFTKSIASGIHYLVLQHKKRCSANIQFQ